MLRARHGAVIRLGDFDVDRVAGRLRLGDIEQSLRAKSFALLRYLAENPGRLITREELLRAVWPGAAVSPSVVRVSIGEVREALGDDPTAPRFIETVGRQGYRFLAEPTAAPVGEPSFVGRSAELAQLHGLLERCRARRRQIVFVAGEAGIGKTALVEHFVDEVRGAGLARVAQGQCVDLHGSTEPYLPVLEMLGRACRDDADGSVHAVLERWAPTWLLQMPGIVDPAVTESLRRRVPTPTRERMLREFADALDVLANSLSLVLVLEDLHWSDASTVDLLTYLAERATPARLLVIGTYRPVDAVVSGHVMRTSVRDLLGRGRAVEMALELLAPRDVETYLTRLFTGVPIDTRLAEVMHRRTDGNPLFLTAITEYLLDHDILTIRDGCWSLGPGDESIPPSLRELVVREMEALPDDEQRMLEAASVVGFEFDAISVAAASGQSPGGVEERCAKLAARGQTVCAAGTTRWPDGSTGGTYTFLHGLHRDTVYNRLAPAERERLHRAVGECLERGWMQTPASVAAVLARHFRCASDWSKAVQHHLAAVDASKLRLADREVLVHCEAVMSLLPRLPPSPERDRIEMVCSLELATSLIIARGYGTPEIRPLVVRARDLARGLELLQVEFMALAGLYMFEAMGGDQRRVLELAADMLAMVDRFPLPLVVVMGHGAFGTAHYNVGNLVAARTHLETARAAWRPSIPKIRVDTRVLFLGTGALVLQQLGDTPEADAWISALIEVSRERLDPLNAVGALRAVSTYRHWAGDREDALVWADRAIQVAAEHGLPEYEAMAKIEKGHATGDLSLQREGFAIVQAAGYRVETPAYRLGMAETLIGAARWDEAREELALALAAAEATGEGRHLAEIHRVRATYLRATDQLDEAVAALHTSIAVASQQQSRLFEARARADLAALPATR